MMVGWPSQTHAQHQGPRTPLLRVPLSAVRTPLFILEYLLGAPNGVLGIDKNLAHRLRLLATYSGDLSDMLLQQDQELNPSAPQ